MSFDKYYNPQLLEAIAVLGWERPSPIQEQTAGRLLNGQDLIGIAQTGTGKTGAYLLPILMKLKYAQGTMPRCLILVPTKELVLQVFEQFNELSTNLDLRCVPVYGGVGAKTQKEGIEGGCDIIVASPGRFMDLYLQGVISLKGINTMVLDEADKLMQMGFMDQVRSILEVVPRRRQNMLFSATFPEKVEELSGEFLLNPERIEVAPQGTTASQVDQFFYKVPNFRAKVNLLGHLMTQPEYSKVLVFVNTKAVADNIFKFLQRKSEGGAKVIHSNKSQNARINAVKEFEAGELRMLVATDVSARGLDIKEVTHVINFDFPNRDHEGYVHRIGRTGRANHRGVALSFLSPPEEWHLNQVKKKYAAKVPELFIPEGVDVPSTGREESISQERAMDWVKRQENPDYKGAFHSKKKRK
jgi:ATP-dependent RNA helicase RhlE